MFLFLSTQHTHTHTHTHDLHQLGHCIDDIATARLLPPLRYTSDNVIAVHLRGSDFDKQARFKPCCRLHPLKSDKPTPIWSEYRSNPWVDLTVWQRTYSQNSDDWTQNRPPLREYINTIGTCFRLTSNALTKLHCRAKPIVVQFF